MSRFAAGGRPPRHPASAPPLKRAAVLVTATLAATAVVVPTANAIGVLSVLQGGYTFYSQVKACKGNLDIGQPCLTSDTANIQLALKEIKALRTEIAANQKLVTAQLSLLQTTLDTKVRSDLVTLLNPVTLNVPDALVALQGMTTCIDARAKGTATCTGLSGTQVPAAQGADDYQAVLIQKVGLMSDDIRSTVAVFTGSELGGQTSGLAGADWLLNKRVQDTAAGVTDAAIMGATKAPVVTAGLANATTKLVTTYCDFLEAYGALKPFVFGLNGQDAIAQATETTARDALYGSAAFSLVSRQSEFTFPTMYPGQVAFIRAADGKAVVVDATGANLKGTTLRPADVFGLATAINAYGKATTFATNRPAAFAKGGATYPVRVRVNKTTVCPTSETKSCGRTPWAVNEMTTAKTGTVMTTTMTLADAAPTWPAKGWTPSFPGTNGVNFKQGFADFTKGPATFDWEMSRKAGNYFLASQKTIIGPGSWVKDAGTTPGVIAQWPSVPAMMG